MKTLSTELESVDVRHPDPLFQQVASRIIKLIRDQRLQEGDRIPSPRLLAGDLGVNELTVRRGMKVLIRQDLLYSRQGKGVFVTEKGGRPQVMVIFGQRIAEGSSSYYSTLFDEISGGLSARGMGVEAIWGSATALSQLSEGNSMDNYAGFVFIATGHTTIFSQVQSRQLPYVMLSATFQQPWTVYSNYPGAYRLGLQYLTRDLPEEITVFTLTEAVNTLEIRRRDLQNALPPNCETRLHVENIEQGQPLETRGYQRTLALAADDKLSKHIFVTDDQIARGVSRALLTLGRQNRPDKPTLAVIASRQQIIPLGLPVTYLSKDAADEARQATRILCDAIDRKPGATTMATIDYQLIPDSGDGTAANLDQ
jgi:DNA-binding transcriptional regulator YhcF (GntR family)